ncbi:tetratricopeptide repeat protein [Demequina pelophila]|uniref:tetratricopeptide repeat protein n=1 Tax=Demequina pelophila TaxID=1638984 RepID=UPI00078132C0|nr:tetratricopeptide repeat protein [Demequina pelophila]
MYGRQQLRRRDRLARFVWRANWRGRVAIWEQVDTAQCDDAKLYELRAQTLAGQGDLEGSLVARRQAAQLEPDSAQRHLAVALTLLRMRVPGLIHDPVRGIVADSHPRLDEAVQELEKALACEPGNYQLLVRLARTHVKRRAFDAAIDCYRQALADYPSSKIATELGQCLQRPAVTDMDGAAAAYEQALELNPSNRLAAERLINVSQRGTQDWRRLWDLASTFQRSRAHGSPIADELIRNTEPLFSDPDQVQPEAILGLIDELATTGESLDLSFGRLVSDRLQFIGALDAGFAVRQRLAKAIIRDTTMGKRTFARLHRRASALAYLGRADEALELLDPPLWHSKSETTARAMQKLAVDAALLAGDSRPLAAWAASERERAPIAADTRMDRLVRGRRVAIVGPSQTPELNGAVIDGYDCIVRPRFSRSFIASQAAFGGSRTDITYYSGRDLGPMIGEAQAAVQDGELGLVVVRPLLFGDPALAAFDWLRHYRSDLSLSLHGNPLGVPRMIYDLLQFDPAEISVFNSDLYTGGAAFAPGYRDTQDSRIGAHSIMNDLIVAHDLRFDFGYLKGLRDAGVISAQGIVSEVLDLSADQYVDRVNEAGTLR